MVKGESIPQGTVCVPFLLCWLQSRKKSVWLRVGLALFAADTVCLAVLCWVVFGGFTGCILDFVMHGWVIFELSAGIRAVRRLQSRDGVL